MHEYFSNTGRCDGDDGRLITDEQIATSGA